MVSADYRVFVLHALQHLFCYIASQDRRWLIGLNQRDQDPSSRSHIQDSCSGTQLRGHNNLPKACHHLWWLWSIKDIHQFIEAATLVLRHCFGFFSEHCASPSLDSSGEPDAPTAQSTTLIPQRAPTRESTTRGPASPSRVLGLKKS